MKRYYHAIICKDGDDDKGYGVYFAEFPGCVTSGENVKDVIFMAEEALILHVEGMSEDGERMPRPSPEGSVVLDEEAGEIALISFRIKRRP